MGCMVILHPGPASLFRLQPTTTAASLSSGAICWDRCDILDAANLHASASQSSKRTLSSWARSPCFSASCGTQLDVQRCDSQLLATCSNILRSKHCCVRRGLIAISLDLHATSYTDDGLSATEVSDVEKG